ncbi:hypothetical protein FKP32DRAFT_272057 [Trametes sanguinea]|nr:hypothetical protein FKP32DRAFT_272057 [Trametes sanguinea]
MRRAGRFASLTLWIFARQVHSYNANQLTAPPPHSSFLALAPRMLHTEPLLTPVAAMAFIDIMRGTSSTAL